MVKIYLLRHGETEWNFQENKYCGITDIPLSTVGRQQAILASDYLRDVHFDAVYSSPLKRANQTAQILSTRDHLHVQTDKRLLEINFGSWEGKTKKQIISNDSKTWSLWLNDPGIVRAGKTGETAQDVCNRAQDFLNEVLEKHSNDTILMVAHNTFNRFLIAHLLSMPLRLYRSIHQENTGITVLYIDEEVIFSQINVHEHLKLLNPIT